MTVDLTVLWHTNRRWRGWMDANTKFVTPAKKLVTLRYMDGETREVRDLITRQEEPDHARNNGRDSTIEQELADVVMLALTVLDEPLDQREITGWATHPTKFDIDYLCHHANDAVIEYREGWEAWGVSCVYRVIEFVLAYPGLDLPAELDRCHRRLAEKHGWVALMKFWYSTGHAVTDGTYINLPVPWLVEEPTE